MNSDSALEEAILDSDLRHINFFNGRLLTGGDLEAEQGVQHAHTRHLGAALGAGVAFGLEVERADASPPEVPVLTISAGLAVNRAGQTLRLQCDQRLALIRPLDPAAADRCVFEDCAPKTAGGTLATGTGYYVLTIAPASRPEGKAPVSGLGNGVAICNSRFFAEGVKFRLFRLNLELDGTPRARSLLAQACFGLVPSISSGAWPETLPERYGWETLMPPGFAHDLEVPIAAIEWSNSGLGFIKPWSVRRRIVPADLVQEWAYFTSARRRAEGEAMFLDFQDDLAALDVAGFAGFSGDRFALLPAGGVLPATVNWKTFLGPLAPSISTPLDAALWPRLLRDTFTREPIALSENGALAAVKVYRVAGRDEVLFVRSPLARLRIFPGRGGSDLVALLIRTANGSLRGFPLLRNGDWPLIADDLPGGRAELWFLRAPRAGGLFPRGPQIVAAEDEVRVAELALSEAAEKAASVKRKLKTALTSARRAEGRGEERFKKLFGAVDAVTAAINTTEEVQAAHEAVARARANLEGLRADEGRRPPHGGTRDEGSPFDNLAGPLNSEAWKRLLGVLTLSRAVGVQLVEGATSILEIPPEQ